MSDFSESTSELGAKRLVAYLLSNHALCMALLTGLCLLTFLPGVLALPPVDRTEVFFAHTSLDMANAGRGSIRVMVMMPIPSTRSGRTGCRRSRPFSREHRRPQLPFFGAPSLIAVTLAALAIFHLASPLTGRAQALLAASLFAVAPLTVLVATLAIANGISLLCAVVALMSLLRIYAGPTARHPRLPSSSGEPSG